MTNKINFIYFHCTVLSRHKFSVVDIQNCLHCWVPGDLAPSPLYFTEICPGFENFLSPFIYETLKPKPWVGDLVWGQSLDFDKTSWSIAGERSTTTLTLPDSTLQIYLVQRMSALSLEECNPSCLHNTNAVTVLHTCSWSILFVQTLIHLNWPLYLNIILCCVLVMMESLSGCQLSAG